MATVDWDYFKSEKGQFRAKKLPPSKGAHIHFQDLTDMNSFREYLNGVRSFKEGITLYQDFFDDSCAYEVVVETFIDVIKINRGQILEENTFLKTQTDLLDRLNNLEIDEEVQDHEPRIFVDRNVYKKMIYSGIVRLCQVAQYGRLIHPPLASPIYRVPTKQGKPGGLPHFSPVPRDVFPATTVHPVGNLTKSY